MSVCALRTGTDQKALFKGREGSLLQVFPGRCVLNLMCAT